jgi:6-phosphogluconolactonase
MKTRRDDADKRAALLAIEHRYADSAMLAQELARRVAQDLADGIALHGHALLAVSGGTTPALFLAALAQQAIEWSRVTVTLTDERWVAPTQARSNEHLVRSKLLQGAAAAAEFVPLYTETSDPDAALPAIAAHLAKLVLPFDAVVLGLGTDGHCASLFPDGDRLAQALDPAGTERVLPMRSASADEARMTLTLPALAATRALYLHIEGAEKQTVLERVLAGEGALAHSPLRAIMRTASVPLNVYVRV